MSDWCFTIDGNGDGNIGDNHNDKCSSDVIRLYNHSYQGMKNGERDFQ